MDPCSGNFWRGDPNTGDIGARAKFAKLTKAMLAHYETLSTTSIRLAARNRQLRKEAKERYDIDNCKSSESVLAHLLPSNPIDAPKPLAFANGDAILATQIVPAQLRPSSVDACVDGTSESILEMRMDAVSRPECVAPLIKLEQISSTITLQRTWIVGTWNVFTIANHRLGLATERHSKKLAKRLQSSHK